MPNNSGDSGASALGQSFKFVERFFAANPRFGTKFDADQDSVLVMLVSNVVRLSQVITSIAEKPRSKFYQIGIDAGTSEARRQKARAES